MKCVANLEEKKGIVLLSSVLASKVILLYNSRLVPGHRLISCQQIGGRSIGKVSELSVLENICQEKIICLFIFTRQGKNVEDCDACLKRLSYGRRNVMILVHEVLF